MNSTSRRERPAPAGARTGSGANSALPYIDQDEDEKASGDAAQGGAADGGGDPAGPDGEGQDG